MKASLKLVIVVSVLSALVVTSASSDENDDHPWASQVVNALRAQPDVLTNTFREFRQPHVGKMITRTIQDWVDLEIDACGACKTVMRLVKTVVLPKIEDYDQIREEAVAVCLQLVAWQDSTKRADLLCPGTVDLYGPHVVSILKNNKATAAKVCSNMNICYNERKTYSDQENRAPAVAGTALQKAPAHVPAVKDESGHLWRHKRETETRDVIRIAQFADVHVDPDYLLGSPTDCGLPSCCRPWHEGTGEAGEFGTLGCNIPQRTVEAFMQKTADMSPDFIIYTGDNPAHHIWENATFDQQMNCTELVMESFKRQLNDYTIYPAMGNHEPWPDNLFSLDIKETQDMIPMFRDHWQELANLTTEQMVNVDAGLYYTALTPVNNLRIITVNSNFWYIFNFYNILNDGGSAVKAMENFMEGALEEASLNGEKVIMSIHHPIGASDSITKYSQWYQDLVIRYRDTIVLQISGHTHHDEFKMFYDENGEPMSTQFVAPSVTSRSGNGGINPGLRVFELDAETFELVDILQYHMNLINATDVMPDIDLVYRMKEEYGMANLSAASVLQLLDTMETDDEVFKKWLHHRETNAPRDFYDTCDGTCKTDYLCNNRYSSYEQVDACRKSFEPTAGTVTETEEDSTELTTSTDEDKDNSASPASTSTYFILLSSFLLTFLLEFQS